MPKGDGWREEERVKEIHAVGTLWWWYSLYTEYSENTAFNQTGWNPLYIKCKTVKVENVKILNQDFEWSKSNQFNIEDGKVLNRNDWLLKGEFSQFFVWSVHVVVLVQMKPTLLSSPGLLSVSLHSEWYLLRLSSFSVSAQWAKAIVWFGLVGFYDI